MNQIPYRKFFFILMTFSIMLGKEIQPKNKGSEEILKVYNNFFSFVNHFICVKIIIMSKTNISLHKCGSSLSENYISMIEKRDKLLQNTNMRSKHIQIH